MKSWVHVARIHVGRAVESAALLYDLRSKPRIINHWLKTAVKAHPAYVAVVLPFCLGIFLAAGPNFFTVLLCAAGFSVVAARLLTELRGSIGYSNRLARSLVKDADAVRENDPSRSLELYESAVALICYPGEETALLDKIRELKKTLARGVGPELAAPAAVPPLDSEKVGERYAGLREIGRGASGTVYKADDLVLDRSVALKELMMAVTDDDARVRFRREAKILALLNHPNIVQIFDLFEHRGKLWIAMELVEGGDLASLLARKKRLDPQAVAHLGEQLAVALAFAHGRGVIHRDLKPLNVLLIDNQTPKITDFGLAKLSEGYSDTIEGMVMGSPRYMSPEQAEGGTANELSDVYSLGIMLYHMLAGRPPFEGDTKSVLMQHLRRRATRLRDIVPDVPPELAALVERMLAKDPADRPSDMSTVSRLLRASVEAVSPLD